MPCGVVPPGTPAKSRCIGREVTAAVEIAEATNCLREIWVALGMDALRDKHPQSSCGE
jgi:hypothetical protein